MTLIPLFPKTMSTTARRVGRAVNEACGAGVLPSYIKPRGNLPPDVIKAMLEAAKQSGTQSGTSGTSGIRRKASDAVHGTFRVPFNLPVPDAIRAATRPNAAKGVIRVTYTTGYDDEVAVSLEIKAKCDLGAFNDGGSRDLIEHVPTKKITIDLKGPEVRVLDDYQNARGVISRWYGRLVCCTAKAHGTAFYCGREAVYSARCAPHLFAQEFADARSFGEAARKRKMAPLPEGAPPAHKRPCPCVFVV